VVDSTRTTFDQRLAAFAAAESDLRAATARREAARLAVVRARPAGVTTLEVARRLRAVADALGDAPPVASRS
jgi:hypothetical protein